MALHVQITQEIAGHGGGNPAINTFGFAAPAGTIVQDLAAAVALYSRLAQARMGVGSTILQMQYRDLPAGNLVAIPWPEAEYAVQYARLGTAGQALILDATNGYGAFQSFIGRAQAGRGLSMCVNERVNGAIRGGRHYLPGLTASVIDDTTGTIIGTSIEGVIADWTGAFKGSAPGGSYFEDTGEDLLPIVWSPTQLGFQEIVTVNASPLPSMLRSRKR